MEKEEIVQRRNLLFMILPCEVNKLILRPSYKQNEEKH